MPCGDYAALQDLHDETVIHCPDGENCKGCDNCSSPPSSPLSSPRPQRAKEQVAAPDAPPPPEFSEASAVKLTPTVLPTPTAKLNHSSRYACTRASPMVCPNQNLVRELAIIRESRDLEGELRSALSYQRAIGVRLISTFHRIDLKNVSAGA